jgi:hypothetical protein
MATDDLTPERARDPKQYIDEVERQLWCAVDFMHNAYYWQDEGVYDAYLAPALADILAAWERDRDRLATVTAQRDALARIAAFELYEDSLLPYDHHYIEASVALAAIRAEQTTTTEPTDAK